MKNKILDIKIFIISIVMLFTCMGLQAGADERMSVGFGGTLGKGEIISLLSKNNLSPKAAYMWADGLSGTYRTSEEVSIESFMDKLTSDSILFFEDSIASNVKHIQEFVKNNSELDISADSGLIVTARSYLSINRQLKAALKSVSSGHPTIYGLELEGMIDELNRVTSNAVVTRFTIINEDIVDSEDRKSESVKPDHLKNRAMDDYSATIPSNAVYLQLIKISDVNGEI